MNCEVSVFVVAVEVLVAVIVLVKRLKQLLLQEICKKYLLCLNIKKTSYYLPENKTVKVY